MDNIFTPIPGCPGYLINCKGQVWSLKSHRYIAMDINSNGYRRAHLRIDRRPKWILCHRVVASIWCHKPESDAELEVDHIDHDRLNPHYANLRWVTRDVNQKARRKYGIRPIKSLTPSEWAAAGVHF